MFLRFLRVIICVNVCTDVKKYSEYTDEQLADALAQGDVRAFNELYDRYYSILYAVAFKLTADEMQVEDILQDIFASLWDGKDRLQITQSISGYLFKAVRYQFFKLVASNKLKRDLFNQLAQAVNTLTADADTAVCYQDLQSVIETLAGQLPGNMGEIFIKSRIHQFSNQEIAEELGLNEKTVRNQLSLANQHIRAKLRGSVYMLAILEVFHQGL